MATNFLNRRSRRLRFQPLEERAMMTGNVGLIVIDGDLYLNGDSTANSVAIAQTQQNGVPVSGSYYIAGLNGTTINGRVGYTATGVTRDFLIDMNGGGDSLLLGPDPSLSHPSSDKFIVPRNLTADMGDSGTFSNYFGSNFFYANGITVGGNAAIRSGYAHDDHFYIRGNFYNDVKINSSAEDAYVTMWDGSVTHDLSIRVNNSSSSGDYRQELSLYDMNIGHDASIYSYAPLGSDQPDDRVYVDINTVSVNNSLSIQSDVTHDQFYLENVTQRYLNVQLGGYSGGGTNRIDLKGVTVNDTATLYGAYENDRFDIQGNFRTLNVKGGHGNDTVLVHDSDVGTLVVNDDPLYADGNDVVSLSYVNVGENASVYTGTGKDTVSIDHLGVNRVLTIDTGDGADHVTLKNCVADELYALLGADDDYLSVSDKSRFRRATFNGGTGLEDTLVRTKDVIFTEYFHKTNFDLYYNF